MPRITIRVPFGLLSQIDEAAKKAKRNRSDWLRLRAEEAVKATATYSAEELAEQEAAQERYQQEQEHG